MEFVPARGLCTNHGPDGLGLYDLRFRRFRTSVGRISGCDAAAFDVERARIAEDAAQITARAVDTSWRELRKLVREALLLTILLTLVLLGLPFAAGYLVGRHRRPRP